MPGMHAKATKPEVVNDADTLHDALSLVAVVVLLTAVAALVVAVAVAERRR